MFTLNYIIVINKISFLKVTTVFNKNSKVNIVCVFCQLYIKDGTINALFDRRFERLFFDIFVNLFLYLILI